MISIKRKFSTYIALSWRSQLLVICVFLLLGINRILIKTVAFRYLSKHYGKSCKNHAFSILANKAQMARAYHIGRTIKNAASHTPWESQCLVQAMTAKTLLHGLNIPYVMFFGIAKAPNDNQKGEVQPLQAHAWLTTGRVSVTGGKSWQDFNVIGTFTSHCR